MDKTCDASIFENSAYSVTDISGLFQGDKTLSFDEFFSASVYCYVSEDFDGSYACISVDGKVLGKTTRFYDLNRKGVWQKLIICFKNNGNISRLI